jgi:signal transduction histidine kinase
MRVLLLLSAILLPPWAGWGQLTRAVDVRALPYERALEKLPVDLTATVGFVEGGTVFVQDETAGTHLHLKPATTDVKAGDRVRAAGVTMPGLYLPGVTVTTMEVLGHGPPPEPVPATYDDLAAGRFHYQRVVVEGLGRRLTQVDENRSLLRLMLGGRLLEVRIDGAPRLTPGVVDARLRIVGLAAGGINDRRQLVFPYLRVAGWEDVTVTEAARPIEQLSLMPVENLLRFGAPEESMHRVKVRGVVLAAFDDGRLFVRDLREAEDEDETVAEPARAIGIQCVSPPTVSVGAVVDAVGFPVMERFSATLADAEVQRTAQPPVAVEPVTVDAGTIVEGTHDADLVSLTGRLAGVYRTTAGAELRLEAGEVSLRAVLPASAPLPEIAAGALLRLTGICQVESSSDKGFRSRADRAVLWLRGPGDLAVIEAPPWWTAQRLGMALGILAGFVVLGLIWIAVLRGQVTRQSAALGAGVAQKAALEERQRIAREFHDTLEQELAGLSLRLDAAVTRPLEDKARGLLETSRQLVKRVQAEARNLVADLRADPTVTADLGASLRELARRVSTDDLVDVRVEIEENIPPLPAHVVHHLRMAAQEAVTNTLKHAEAKRIVLGLKLSHGGLCLTICDDGRGIDHLDTHGRPGHFGCMGIRERVSKLNGEVEWKRAEPKGTCVEVRVAVASA